VLPAIIRLIAVAALLLLARRIAPEMSPRWRVWMPLAAGAFPIIDAFSIVWHLHDLYARGGAALSSMNSMPVLGLWSGLLRTLGFSGSHLAMVFAIVLVATWPQTTPLEKSALLFAVFLSKSQIFLAVGTAYGAFALYELLQKRWRPAMSGALAVLCVLGSLRYASTYGSTAPLALGRGALSGALLMRHNLGGRHPEAIVLAIEGGVLIAGIHLLVLAIGYGIRRLRVSVQPELTLGLAIAAGGLLVPAFLRMAPSEQLRHRFLAIHGQVADRLFMPLPVYLDRILDIAVGAAFDAFTISVPILGIPLLVAWLLETRRARIRALLTACAVSLLAIGGFGSSALGTRQIARTAKVIPPEAWTVLRAIPPDAHAVLTNDLEWDDRFERHLPLLNIWAPAASGRQFWASAFMFTFQHPDADERLRVVQQFFSPATSPLARSTIARRHGIDFVFLRRDLAPTWVSDGWPLVAKDGRYELYRVDPSRPESVGPTRTNR
jgi:hypothetical protein